MPQPWRRRQSATPPPTTSSSHDAELGLDPPDDAGAVVARRKWRAPLNRASLRSGADLRLCPVIRAYVVTGADLLGVSR